MANFFSADYWKALYFKAMGGQETAVDPNAMSGSFAGSSSWTGTLDQPEGAMSGSFAGSSSWTGTATSPTAAEPEFHGPRRTLGWIRDAAYSLLGGRKKRRPWEEEAESIAAKVAPLLADPDPKALERAIEERAEEIVGRLVVATPAATPTDDLTNPAFGRGDQAAISAAELARIEADAAAALAQAALALAEERRRKMDEEDALIALLLAA